MKAKINELALTGALGLAGLSIITPMFVDIIFDGLIIGLMYLAAKTDK